MNLPNIISLARLFSVPVLVWLILTHRFDAAFWLFMAAGISDALDGFIAKHWKKSSKLGMYLDPLADKALLMGVYITLGAIDQIPLWLAILVVFRDLLIIGGVLLLHVSKAEVKLRTLIISKFNTALQILLIIFVLAELSFQHGLDEVKQVAIYLIAISTILSGGAYISSLFRDQIPETGGTAR
ncbi:MAG: CDP-alcohol phosphatidyltransferase family protein [Rhodospirillaceae bacterium]